MINILKNKMNTAVLSAKSRKKTNLKNKNKYKYEMWFPVLMPPCTALVWSDMLFINTAVTSGAYLASVFT